MTAMQAASVSSVVTQKAHSALRWLIAASKRSVVATKSLSLGQQQGNQFPILAPTPGIFSMMSFKQVISRVQKPVMSVNLLRFDSK